MFDKVKRVQKARETNRFVEKVQKELIEKNNTEWKNKVAEYVRDNIKAPYIGSTVIFLWCTLSEILRNGGYYKEAVLVGELAVLQSVNLTEGFRDIQIKALLALGIAQVEGMQLKKGTDALERARGMLKPEIRSYEFLRLCCGMNLSYAYTKSGKYEESRKVLESLIKWIKEEKPSNISRDDLLLIYLAQGNNLLMQGQYQRGLQLVEKLEKEAEKFHMQEESIYYKILSLHGCYEKMINHVEQYYALTKRAVELAKKAGDIQEERAYRANLIDALVRLGKDEEVLLQVHEIFPKLDQTGESIESLNTLQSYMNILLRFAQAPQMLDELGEMIDKAKSSWEKIKIQGIDCHSRDALKIESQFGALALFQKKYSEAEILLSDCLKYSQEVLGESDIDTLSIREALAGSKRMQGDYKGALVLYLEIEKLRIDNGQEKSHSCCETLRSIAYMYYFMGEKQEAIKRILLYFDNIDKYSYEVFGVFDEAAWKTFSMEFLTTLHDLLGWIAASPEEFVEIEKIYELVLRFKNRIYDEEMFWKARNKSAALNSTLTEYYHMLKAIGAVQDSEERIELLNRKKCLEDEISKWRPEILNSSSILRELRINLNAEEAILDYTIYYKNVGYEDVERRAQGYLVFVITRDMIRFYDLGNKQILDDDMKDFYDVVSSYEHDPVILEQQLTLLRAGLGTYHFANDLKSIKRIYLGLDGASMPSLPWHYILSEYDVQVLPSFISFGEKSVPRKHTKENCWEIDFFANPDMVMNKEKDYEMEIPLLIARTTKILLADLPEVSLHAYEGKQAGREEFIRLKSPDILHVAAHGKFVPESDKFQKSIIQLSGKDGAVTMLDVMQMDLSATELVILDACESGVGDFRKDEGVYGFARAFFIAGTEGILTCLWKVDALFSVIFLDYFYNSYFISGGDAERALEQSRDIVRKMTKGNVLEWLTCRQGIVEEMDDVIKRALSKFDANEKVFDKPVYWACFELSRPVRLSMC